MLAFVTSLRARILAADWDYHVRLLERMLTSCLAQTDPHIRVIIVCHDRPELRIADPRIHFIDVNFPPPRRDFDDMTTDKVLKVSLGAEWAIAMGCRFITYVDADDLVSRHLAEHVNAHPESNGWYFPEGFSHQYGRPWVRRSVDHHLMCGTCSIVRADLLTFAPDPVYRGQRVETLAAAGHTNYLEVMARRGAPLEPLPFPGSIYLLHPDSVITALPPPTNRSIRTLLREARQSLQRARRIRPLRPSMAREFSIPWSPA